MSIVRYLPQPRVRKNRAASYDSMIHNLPWHSSTKFQVTVQRVGGGKVHEIYKDFTYHGSYIRKLLHSYHCFERSDDSMCPLNCRTETTLPRQHPRLGHVRLWFSWRLLSYLSNVNSCRCAEFQRSTRTSKLLSRKLQVSGQGPALKQLGVAALLLQS